VTDPEKLQPNARSGSVPSSTLETAALRPFRGLAWALYLVFAVGFSLMVTYSVFSSAIRMSPARPATTEVLSLEVCFQKTRSLYDLIEAQFASLPKAPSVSEADRRFLTFRNDWIAQKRALEGQCQLEDPARESLKKALASLDKIGDAYTTASVQFVSGIGPELEVFKGLTEPK
jgi:hypothetical protein